MSSKVLLVEDDPTNATLMEVILAHEGLEIVTRRRAEEGVAEAERLRPDLVVVDLDLSGSEFDGLEVIRRLKTDPRTCDIPIIACTAAVLRFEEREAREAGAEAFLSKPYNVEDVRALVKRLL